MGHEIPEPYVWDESFKVFYETLDEEHKLLFQAVFNVAGEPASEANLKNLVDVTQNHFTHEEKMMTDANYDMVNHKKAHDEFLEKIKGLASPVGTDSIDYAKEWLVNHIKGTDFQYKEKL